MRSLVEKAEVAEARDDHAEAFALWMQILGTEKSARAYAHLALAARELKKWDVAEEALWSALSIDSHSALLMESMGNLWATRTDKDDRAASETAKDWYIKSLSIEKTAPVLNQLGVTRSALGDPSGAKKAFEEAISIDPNYEESLYNLAENVKSSEPERAIQLLERAVRIDPRYLEAHRTLGLLREKGGELQEAEKHFRECLEICPTDYFSLLFAANLQAVCSKNDEAEKLFSTVINLYPTMGKAFEFYANFLDSLGEHERAKAIRSRSSNGASQGITNGSPA